MSLQIWLPLNGDLHNQGLCNLGDVVTNTATINNNGKIGQCYEFNGSNIIQFTKSNIVSRDEWSAACWFYRTASQDRQYLVGINGTTAGNFIFTLNIYKNKLTVRIAGIDYSSSVVLESNKWYHAVCTYNGSLKMYLNGELIYTKDSTVTPSQTTNLTIGARGGNAGYFTGRMNDVRIYDHCLSDKEVKEIAKGLVLHYPLNDIRVNKIESTTYSGAIVNFNARDEQLPIDDITINIEPVQSGSGDPSPQNVRSISGRTGCKIAVSNVFNYAAFVDWTEGYYYNAQNVRTKNGLYKCTDALFPVVPGKTYQLFYNKTLANAAGCTMCKYKSDESFINRVLLIDDTNNTTPGIRRTTFTAVSNAYFVRFSIPSGAINFCLYDGANSIIPVESIHNCSFSNPPGTVYSGTLTINNGVGELIVDKEFISLDGNVEWIEFNSDSSGSGKFFASVIPVNSAKQNTDYISNQYLFAGDGTTQSKNITIDKRFYGQRSYGRIWVYDSDYFNNLNGFKTALNTTPLQIIYPLNSPVSYTLTAEQITTLLGTNNIWADCGNVSITYSDNGSKIIYDTSGYSNNGIVSGTLTTATPSPRYNTCTVFNGTNAAIQVPNLTPEAVTISFWMKRGANTGTKQFMYTAWSGITCELNTSGGPTFAVNRSNYPTITGNNITVASGWVHYCATFDTTNGMKLYQNGALVASNSNLTAISYNISTNYIGLYNSNYYNGSMSDFRIYATALTEAQVKELYNTSIIIENDTIKPRDLE